MRQLFTVEIVSENVNAFIETSILLIGREITELFSFSIFSILSQKMIFSKTKVHENNLRKKNTK